MSRKNWAENTADAMANAEATSIQPASIVVARDMAVDVSEVSRGEWQRLYSL